MFKKIFVFFLLSLFIWFFYYSSKPQNVGANAIPESEFSTARAFEHVEKISQAPHFVGSPFHSRARTYIVNELQELGLEVQTQEGYDLSNDGSLSMARNIVARIPGNSPGPAVLLMSHYDSAVHSSFGASDAASGVATILEGIRAFLAEGGENENDIIILFTDAEELGLHGASLFVKKHPWAKEVGVALNFESRGSGGDSFMLLETNSGNAELIKHFKKAKPEFPVSNSLAYSVYKMLPNDTDLTVLRENGNINGFNFAFIDDHFDYHTANDTPENLDLETLAHQGSYLMPLLYYFKDADLTALNSEEDLLYFHVPLGVLISYPFSWIFPMLIMGFVLFFAVVIYGIFKKHLELKSIFKGAVPFLISLLGSGLIVFLFWQLNLIIYPEYSEMEHGFTYNGYYYIAAAIFLSLTITLFSYHKFQPKENVAATLIFPILFWLLICALAAFYLEGAAYFIIPGYFVIFQLLIMMVQKKPNLFLMLLLSLPALIVLLPLLINFPVALGLKILFVAAILVVLLFSLLLPVFGYFRRKKALGLVTFLIFSVLLIIAHFKSSFSEERQKPNSLVYVLDADENTATWNTYDNLLDSWTQSYLGEDPAKAVISEDFSSKYNSGFSYSTPAPVVNIPEPGVVYRQINTSDSLSGKKRYSLKIAPNRKINRMEIFTDRNINFEDFTVNNLKADSISLGKSSFHIFSKRWRDRLLTYQAANKDTLRIEFSIKGETAPDFQLFAAGYDLLENEELNVKPREKTMMPRPFVLNDAIVVKKILSLE